MSRQPRPWREELFYTKAGQYHRPIVKSCGEWYSSAQHTRSLCKEERILMKQQILSRWSELRMPLGSAELIQARAAAKAVAKEWDDPKLYFREPGASDEGSVCAYRCALTDYIGVN